MSLTFTALPIEEGDAFLLKNGGRNYLFDAGGSKRNIIRCLKNEKITNLDVVICSHNDKDHTNGFKGLLDSKYNKHIGIGEIWLPGSWAKIIQFVIDNVLNDKKWTIVDCALRHPSCGVKCELDGHDSESGKNSIEIENLNAHLSDFSYHYNKYIAYNDFTHSSLLKLMLDNIIDIAKLAYNNGRKIRWLEPANGYVKNDIDYGFVALNSKEVLKIDKIGTVSVFIKTLMLTIENEYSLVFEYYKNGIPIVRFSADSDRNYSSQKPYKHNIIITAPHHGSKNNKDVYKLDNDNAIWVRTNHRGVQTCTEFLNLGNKYCLKCISKKFLKQIDFEYKGIYWNNTNGNKCQC